jgi:hypothetical protein
MRSLLENELDWCTLAWNAVQALLRRATDALQ